MQEAELGSDAQKMIAGRNSQCRQRFRLASPTILASGCCSTVNARGRAPLLCFGGSVSVGFVCNGTASPVPDPIFLPISSPPRAQIGPRASVTPSYLPHARLPTPSTLTLPRDRAGGAATVISCGWGTAVIKTCNACPTRVASGFKCQRGYNHVPYPQRLLSYPIAYVL